jgi:hypothetical protein
VAIKIVAGAVLLLLAAAASEPLRAAGAGSEAPKAAPGRELFVSPVGSDAGDGSEAKPLATLERARDAVRAMKKAGPLPAGGVAVNLRAGTHPLAATFRLAAEDSGSPDAPIVYRAYKGEAVRIIGGREVRDFKAVSDAAILARLERLEKQNQRTEAEKRIDEIRSEVEKVLDKLGQMEIET